MISGTKEKVSSFSVFTQSSGRGGVALLRFSVIFLERYKVIAAIFRTNILILSKHVF